jgi:type IV pilus assembly protein PilC
MPSFHYEAMNNVGQAVKDDIEAPSREEAVSKLRGMGLFPTKIGEKAGRKGGGGQAAAAKASQQAAASTGRKKVGGVSNKLLTQFTRQLSTLQDAGLPILRSLRILEQQQKPGMLRVAIRQVADDVEGGSTLSEAMAQYPKAFDKLYTNMVAAGEAGGVLDRVLRRLAEFMEAAQRLKRKVIGAMIYPIAVITVAILIVLGIMRFIIPKFIPVFESLGGKLPAVTQMLLDISGWISYQYGWAWILGVPIGLIIALTLIRQSQGGKYFVDSMKLKVPVLGTILSKTSVVRWSRTLGTLLEAGVPILEAINITKETSGNEVFARAMGKVHDAIREGEDFATPLRQSRLVEPMVVNMIDVGEETGDLDKMLTKVADTYDEEVEALVATMVSLLEPFMVVTLGVIVGFIVVAIFMPLPMLIQTVQQQ